MQLELVPGLVPSVLATLGPREAVYGEHGIMLYKDTPVQVGRKTLPSQGLLQGVERHTVGGLPFYLNEFTGPGHVAFSRDGVGELRVVELAQGEVLDVRRLVRRMGLENLLQAMALVREACPDALLVVAGQGALRQELEQRARGLGLDGAVRFAGRVPDADLPLVYRAADVSVVPTVALEGFGLIVVESLASGTPVLGTPVGGIPEVLRPLDPELICESPAPRDLAERLVAAVRGEMRLPSAEACAAYARREFAWPTVARRVRDVYAEAVGGAGGVRRLP